MNHTGIPNKLLRAALALAGLFLTAASLPVTAGDTDLADIPLANATTATILPNIMLDLDNSGSMAWDYMPDYVRYTSTQDFNKWCRGTNTDNYTLVVCEPGDPPYFASGFNGLYYNPDVRYGWPVNADGTPRADLNGNTSYGTPWGAVASDGYGIQKIDNSSTQSPSTSPCLTFAVGGSCPTYAKSATINLATAYPERVWCKSSSDTPPSANCKSALDASNAYLYPNSTYKNLKMVYGAPYYYKVGVEWCKTADNSPHQNYGKAGTCQAKKTSTYNKVRFHSWSRVNIKSTTTFPAKAAGRTDCAAAACTYAEEMANFANWYAWYRTRMQMTKSAIGLAFKDIRGTPKTGAALSADPADPTFFHARVGLTTINNPIVLNIANFDADQRTSFYTDLYSISPLGGTPLRSSLDAVGKMYKGTSTTYTDPLQYSCQRNFAILATDGYWNDNYSGVNDPDGAAAVTRPSLDALKTANTLADVAYHYYHTDLRSGTCSGPDVCTDNVPPSGTHKDVDDVAQHQHMTTFTVGLGLDGTLTFNDAYKASTSGDYFDIKQGTRNWPKPTANTPETIDDLWHAAVNGRGTYFSTKDPNALEEGLKAALGSIESTTGSGAAAATSNLQPTTGDNNIYIATYHTVKWDGEISAYTADLSSGAISETAIWQASPLLKAKISATGDGDSRVIYTADGATRTLFKAGAGGLTAAQLAYFDNTKLTQSASWDTTQKSTATPTALVNFLRGQDRYEDQDRDGSYGAYQRLYRDRDKVLGDIVHAQPVYVKVPQHNFRDAGYGAFKTANANRLPSLYVAANDGMLHAFDAATGQERWAYMPPLVLPELWRLAEADYTNNHRFYLDGPLTITDAYFGGTWKTVLIGGMGKGGKGYYALDVTDPTDPKPLWTFSSANAPNLGYSYGTAVVTKLANGTWVAVVTSGYNNADGQGYVYVLDLADGSVLKTISTNVGNAGQPSGLARLNVQVVDFSVDNTAVGAYGGDLLGNMWRFDLDAGTATKLASLGADKPIMAAPEIADVEGKKAVYFGTGRYLGEDDLTDDSAQTIYAIKDDGTTTVTGTSQLVQQTVSGSGATRDISNNSVDWSTKFGWYVNLPDLGERVAIDPQLYFGTLVFASTVPTASACQPGGYSWLYQLNFKTGGNVKQATPAATRFTSPIVGLTVAKLPSGTPMIYPITADGKKPAPTELEIAPASSTTGAKRVLWRELTGNN